MNEKELSEAIRLGSDVPRSDDKLGKFGLGLITASISIGKRLLIITKKDGKFLTGIHDLDEIIKKGNFIKEIRESSAFERQAFKNNLGEVKSGTVVIIQNIDNLHNNNSTQFNNILIKRLGEVFRDFISAGKEIELNGKEIHPLDPMLRDMGSVELIDIKKDFTGINGEGKEMLSTIRLRVYMLPEKSKGEEDQLKINQHNQGFYIMRNNRQIAGGTNLGMFTKHNNYNRFRAEIYFGSSLDKAMGVNFKKENISKTAEQATIYNWIEANVMHQLDSIKNQKKKKKDSESVDHDSSKNVIIDKYSILKKPNIHGVDKIPKNIKFTTEENSHLGPLFLVDVLGDTINIRYNSDHPFYTDVINLYGRENKNLLNAIDFIVYSTAMSVLDISSTEETIKLKDKIIDNLSDNLRALLS
jgi:hypothetical protein